MAEDLDRHLTAIQLRDEHEFAKWAAAVEPRIRGALRSFAAQVDVEAVLQETLLQVWQVAPRFKPDGRPNGLLRLAFRCARNQAITEVRRDRSHPEEMEELERTLIEAEEVAEPEETDPALRRILADCAARLPEKPRTAMTARMRGGGVEPDRVLADRLGVKLNTFLQNVTRARKLLLACLEQAGVDLHEQFA